MRSASLRVTPVTARPSAETVWQWRWRLDGRRNYSDKLTYSDEAAATEAAGLWLAANFPDYQIVGE